MPGRRRHVGGCDDRWRWRRWWRDGWRAVGRRWLRDDSTDGAAAGARMTSRLRRLDGVRAAGGAGELRSGSGTCGRAGDAGHRRCRGGAERRRAPRRRARLDGRSPPVAALHLPGHAHARSPLRRPRPPAPGSSSSRRRLRSRSRLTGAGQSRGDRPRQPHSAACSRNSSAGSGRSGRVDAEQRVERLDLDVELLHQPDGHAAELGQAAADADLRQRVRPRGLPREKPSISSARRRAISSRCAAVFRRRSSIAPVELAGRQQQTVPHQRDGRRRLLERDVRLESIRAP